MYSGPIVMLYLVFHYLYVSNHWFGLQATFLGIGIFCTYFTYRYIPESPHFLYATGEFEESRLAIAKIDKFNRNKR
jgi:hypothetical protein